MRRSYSRPDDLLTTTTLRSWGESAGAISVALHMVANGGNAEGLFRAAFMESGSALPVGDITDGQPHYDALVQQTGCAGSNDTLQCLRELPFDSFKEAMDMSPGIFDFQVWQNHIFVCFVLEDCNLNIVFEFGMAPAG